MLLDLERACRAGLQRELHAKRLRGTYVLSHKGRRLRRHPYADLNRLYRWSLAVTKRVESNTDSAS